MADLTWLHISDIHFHPKTEWRDSHARDTLLEYLKQCFAQDPQQRPDLVFCTGDIAFGESGAAPLAGQYQDAIAFFDRLLAICGPNGTRLPRERLFVVPGNHDVNRDKINGDAQEALYSKAERSGQHAAEINQRVERRSFEFQQALARLDEYASFVESHLKHQHDPEKRICYARMVEIKGLKVGIAGFNSAWSCAGEEDDRKLWLGAEWQFNQARQALKETHLRIGLMHHPVDNLNQTERELVGKRLASDFHFFLHGHSHDAWVTPGTHITVAAGAASKDEFGVNLTQLDLASGTGKVRLHRYDTTDWSIAPVPHHAPSGVWEIAVPPGVPRLPAAEAVAQAGASPHRFGDCGALPNRANTTAAPKLYGRDKLLKDSAAALQQHALLLVYGLRGNGKSRVVEALAKLPPLAGKEEMRIQVSRDTTAASLYRQIAHMLADRSEAPKPPDGDIAAMVGQFQSRCPSPPRPFWLWLDRAHLLLDSKGFAQVELRKLLLALHTAYGADLPIVLELRERPPIGLLGRNCGECEVPGLDKESLAECLADAAPPEAKAEWTYKGDQLKRVYGWLGGGGGKQAHPLALGLLIEVAKVRRKTPVQVLERDGDDMRKKLEEALLDDLINSVLSRQEREMIQALALYRRAIPYDHANMLEQSLKLPGAWDGIDRRCLLTANFDGSQFYLHGFISGWLRAGVGYQDGAEGTEAGLNAAATPEQRRQAERLHGAVADCWLQQLSGGRRKSKRDMDWALEAFFHLTAAGEGWRVQQIAVELLSGNEQWALQKIRHLYEHLFKNKAPIPEQRQVLEYWVALDPQEHMAQRFLGECWAKEEGRASRKALQCFERACELLPGFPQYWANLGKSLLAQGADGAKDFLLRLETLRQTHPHAINDFVLAVQANCLVRTGQTAAAATLRTALINAGSRDPAFYTDEAQARLEAGDAAAALDILDLATQRGCFNDFATTIRATALRMAQIDAGSRDPAIYADEAQARLAAGDAAGALAILDLANQRGCSNDITTAIRVTALQQSGQTAAAATLRMAQIAAGSRNPTFYNDEAQARLAAGDVAGALQVLDLAAARGCADEITAAIRATARQPSGQTEAASSLRIAQIDADSREPSGDGMRLIRLKIKNFRCFESLEIGFHPELTVLVAPNGSGKTTVLDAARIALWPFIKGFDLGSQTGKGATIQIPDVRLVLQANGNMEHLPPSSIEARGELFENEAGQPWVQSRERIKPGTITLGDTNAKKLTKFASTLEKRSRDSQDTVILPLVSYLGTSRLWFEGRFTSTAEDVTLNRSDYSRTSGYLNCLSYSSSFKTFTAWYGWIFRSYWEEKISAVESKEPVSAAGQRFAVVVEVIKNAVDALVKDATGWHSLEYKSSQNQQLVMNHEHFGSMPLEMLSDGIRNAIAMVADLAFRAYKLNPHLGADAALKTPGVAMIDEVDMFLHPAWQQTIVASLRKAFPRIQFIVTTHSPQVLTTVPSECIRILEDGDVYSAPPGSEGAEPGRLLKQVLGLKDVRPLGNEATKELKEYLRMVYSDEWDSEQAQALRQKLDARYRGNEPELQEADLYIENRKWELGDEASV